MSFQFMHIFKLSSTSDTMESPQACMMRLEMVFYVICSTQSFVTVRTLVGINSLMSLHVMMTITFVVKHCSTTRKGTWERTTSSCLKTREENVEVHVQWWYYLWICTLHFNFSHQFTLMNKISDITLQFKSNWSQIEQFVLRQNSSPR